MKIGIIVGRFPVLSEQFIINHITGLIDLGHEVTILSVARPKAEAVQPLVSRYKLIERTVYADLPSGGLARVFGALGIVIKGIFLRPRRTFRALAYGKYRTGVTSGKTLYFLNAWGALRFDLLHAHFGPNGLSGAYLKDIGVAPALAVAFHGSDINSYPRRYGEGVYEYMYRRVDLITSNTNFTAGKIVANGADPARIHIVPESLRTTDYPVRSYSPDQGRFVVLTVGRLVEKKGHRYMIEAIARVKGKIPGLEYRMVGGGGLQSSLEVLARELGVEDICKFLGPKTADEILPEYHRCDLFVLPSVTASSGDMEGQALVLQEAQAVGAPVLSTLHNGIPDGVLSGQTGYLVPEKDPDALASKLLELAGNRAHLRELGNRGPAFVRGTYDTAVVSAALDEAYAQAIPGWRGAGA